MKVASGRAPIIHFIANGMYSGKVAGGDLHFFEMARVADRAGYAVHLFGSGTFRTHWEARKLPGSLTPTDGKQLPKIDEDKFSDQLRLFWEYARKLMRTLRRLDEIGSDDCVYATSDYWFDVLPALLSAARKKVMVLHMESPTLWQIISKGRADVRGTRLASIYYWISQTLSLRSFRFCKNKQVLYLHPQMRSRLLKLGYRPDELEYVSYGVDVELANNISQPEKVHDLVWIGRVHRQKGIDDLLRVLVSLRKTIPGFRALIIGNVREALQPRVEELGLQDCVEFSGFVSEAEKFRFFKASRVFVMPSLHEGSPRVIGEALACGIPVVAYDVVTYRPLFGDLVRYVPCFDVRALQAETERQVVEARAGRNYLADCDLERFQNENSWQTTQKKFLAALGRLSERDRLRSGRHTPL
jgi:glycosyltransferase involved in cell wall biosynthesis